MKKLAVLFAVLFAAAPVFAGDSGIFKLSLWGDIAAALPNNTQKVTGLVLGIGANTDTVYGLQWDFIASTAHEVRGVNAAWIYTKADVVYGLQESIVAINESEMIGLQGGWINLAHGTVTGAQIGIYNQVEDLHGLQLGLVNNARHISKGLQLGIVNIAKNGWFPVMVLVNGRF